MRPEIIAKLNALHLKSFNERLATSQPAPVADTMETVFGTNFTRPAKVARGWTLDDVTFGQPTA